MLKRLPKYQCILFDCDGTLIDSESMLATVIAERIRAMGYPHFTNEYCLKEFRGCDSNHVRKWLVENFKDFPIEKFDAQMQIRIESTLFEDLSKYLIEIPGAKKLMESIGEYPKCIVSNGHLEIIKHSLKVTQLTQYFNEDKIFTFEQVKTGKPAPDVYLLACERMNVDPTKCIAIEDSIVGATAAVSAGIPTIGIIAHKEDEHMTKKLMQVGVLKVIHNLSDFYEIIHQ